MGLGLTVKPFYVYVLMLKMNQSLSQNIRHINTTIKILWGPPKCGGPGHVPPVPPPKSGPVDEEKKPKEISLVLRKKPGRLMEAKQCFNCI